MCRTLASPDRIEARVTDQEIRPEVRDYAAGLADRFVSLGRELTSAKSVDEVLRAVSTRAFQAIPAAEHAAISRKKSGGDEFETVYYTDELPPKVDQIQYDLGHGPCVDAAVKDTVFCSGDLANDDRWPDFGKRAAAQYGINSMLAVRIYLEDDEARAGLNLYSPRLDAFDASDSTTATLLATHGGLALSAAKHRTKAENLEIALESSRRIGVAIGILMASQRLTDGQAFDLLRIASQRQQRKLRDIAEDVIFTGTVDLPEPPLPRERN